MKVLPFANIELDYSHNQEQHELFMNQDIEKIVAYYTSQDGNVIREALANKWLVRNCFCIDCKKEASDAVEQWNLMQINFDKFGFFRD